MAGRAALGWALEDAQLHETHVVLTPHVGTIRIPWDATGAPGGAPSPRASCPCGPHASSIRGCGSPERSGRHEQRFDAEAAFSCRASNARGTPAAFR